MNANKSYYPDANSTMRVTYGVVDDYKPRDAVQYDFITYLEGVIEKEDPTSDEFVVPANTGAARTNTVAIDYYDEENALMYTEYLVIEQASSASNLTGGGAQLLSNTLDNLTT